jgi:DNA repair protein RadC
VGASVYFLSADAQYTKEINSLKNGLEEQSDQLKRYTEEMDSLKQTAPPSANPGASAPGEAGSAVPADSSGDHRQDRLPAAAAKGAGISRRMYRIPVVSLRLVRERSVPYQARRISSSLDTFEFFRTIVEDYDRETFWIICLDTKNKINWISLVAVGSLNSAIVHPREVFKVAVLANAAALILVHNHPSGEPTPSAEDRSLTSRLVEAAKLLGMKILDHIIIGDGRYLSFADEGLLT